MALKEGEVMEKLGAIGANIEALRASQNGMGERLGTIEQSLEKKTGDIYTYVNDLNSALTKRINDVDSSGHRKEPNGNGSISNNGKYRYQTLLSHPATRMGGSGVGGAIFMWLMQHIAFK